MAERVRVGGFGCCNSDGQVFFKVDNNVVDGQVYSQGGQIVVHEAVSWSVAFQKLSKCLRFRLE